MPKAVGEGRRFVTGRAVSAPPPLARLQHEAEPKLTGWRTAAVAFVGRR